MLPKLQVSMKKSTTRFTEQPQSEETRNEGFSSSHIVLECEDHKDSDNNSETHEKCVQRTSEDRVKILEVKLNSIIDALANTMFSHHPRTSSSLLQLPQPMTQPMIQP